MFENLFKGLEKYKNKEIIVLFDEADSFLSNDFKKYVDLFFYNLKNLKENSYKKIKFLFTTNLPSSIDERIRNISTLFKFNDLAAAENAEVIKKIIETIIKNKFYNFFKICEPNNEEEDILLIEKEKEEFYINLNFLKNGNYIRTFKCLEQDQISILKQITNAGSQSISFAQIETFLSNCIFNFYFKKEKENINMYDIYKMIRFGGPKDYEDFEPIKPKKEYNDYIHNINIKDNEVFKKNLGEIKIELNKYDHKNFKNIKIDENDKSYKFFQNLYDCLNEKNEDEKEIKLEFFKKPVVLCSGEKGKEKNFELINCLVKKLNGYNLYRISKKDVLDNLKKDGGELWLIKLLETIKKNNEKNIVYIEDLEELFYSRDKNYIPKDRIDNPKHKIFINIFLTYLDELIQNENFILFFNIKRKVLNLYNNFQSAIFDFNKQDFKIVDFDPNLENFSDYLKKKELDNFEIKDEYIYNIYEKLKYFGEPYILSQYVDLLLEKDKFFEKVRYNKPDAKNEQIEELMKGLKKIRELIFVRKVINFCKDNNVGKGLDQALFRAERFGLKIETEKLINKF